MSDPDGRPERSHSTPRWVKVSGIIAIAAIAVLVVVMALAGGDHGPGRHLPGGGGAPVEHTPPPGGHS